MRVIREYINLENEIEIIKLRMEQLEREDYSIEKGRKETMGLEQYINRKNQMNNMMARLQATLEDKEETMKDIKQIMNRFTGIEYKIAYKRFVEGKKLDEIASELGISQSWVMKKSARVSEKLKLHIAEIE